MKHFEKIYQNANNRHQALKIGWSEFLECIQAVKFSLTEDWIENSFYRLEKAQKTVFWENSVHPILDILNVAGDTQIIELAEIGNLLKYASNSKDFNLIIDNLKSSYFSTLFQLSIAYRLDLIGIHTILEPKLESGRRSDLEIELANRKILIECFRPENTKDYPKLEFEYLLKKSLKIFEDLGVHCSIGIELKNQLTVTIRKKIIRTLEKIKGNCVVSSNYEYYSSDEEFSLSLVTGLNVMTQTKLFHSNFQMSRSETMELRKSLVKKSEVQKSYPNDIQEKHFNSQVVLWLPANLSGYPTNFDATINNLIKKIKGKIPQIKNSNRNEGIIFLEHWIAIKISRDNLEKLRFELNKHSNLKAIVICNRYFDFESNRFRLRLVTLKHNEISKELNEVLDKFEYNEQLQFSPKIHASA